MDLECPSLLFAAEEFVALLRRFTFGSLEGVTKIDWPGKLFPGGQYKIDTNLRMGAGYKLPLPFEPVLAFAAKDGWVQLSDTPGMGYAVNDGRLAATRIA